MSSSSSKKHRHRDKSPEKNLLKSLETPEQKRLRRFAKKEAKDKKRKEQMGWDEEYMGYTNTDNPFGDTNLLNTFVWEKKLEKEGLKNVGKEQIEKCIKLKMEQNKLELEKVKKIRLEREREREMRDEEVTRVQREKEAAQFSEWEKEEDIFHLKQAKLRSKIRIQDGRAKPIDLLARYCNSEESEEDFTVEMHEPYTYLNGLDLDQLEDVQEDIKIYIELENGKNFEYWNDLQIIVQDEIDKLSEKSGANKGERRESINSAVGSEIVSIFKGKTPKQLQAMHRQIEKKISKADEGVDIAYWETLLSRLNAYMARARLRERHEENLRHKLFKLKEEQGVTRKEPPLFPCVSSCMDSSAAPSTSKSTDDEKSQADATEKLEETVVNSEPSTSSLNEENDVPPKTENVSFENKSQEGASKTEEAYNPRYSPVLILFEKLDPSLLVVDAYEDAQRLEFLQKRVLKLEINDDNLTSEEKAFEKIAKKGMDADEAVFSVEYPVASAAHSAYLLSDKYRPRKPRYFNRVHTGFEWNKYNQSHYDMDNPPPKIVQGYKFNIFYPDLLDKAKTPEYTLTPCEDNKDFAVLRFHAGPPYEDIAFKIVNRECEYSYKKGFRCQFHNNIFQLYFHFKRYRYRR